MILHHTTQAFHTHEAPARQRLAPVACAAVWLFYGCGIGGAANAAPSASTARQAAAAAPVDFGAGPGLPLSAVAAKRSDTLAARSGAATQSAPVGPTDAAVKGVFGAAFNWPLIPIHAALTNDGRVMTFGTTPDGFQNGLLNYNVWDPALGQGSEAFLSLPNVTGTDIFCAGQALIPGTGEYLIVGGDRIQSGSRNWANSDANLYNPVDNSLVRTTSMQYQRWYASAVTLDNGDQVVLGGRINKPVTDDDNGGVVQGGTFASTPEVYNRSTQSWRTLTTAASDAAYGATKQSWYYPRGWLGTTGKVFIVAHNGWLFYLTAIGNATIKQMTPKTAAGDNRLPSVMYAPGKILSVRNDLRVDVIDINNFKPVVTTTGPISRHRLYGNATVLPDGKVWVNGGSPVGNVLGGEHYVSELWNPVTGIWTETASATKARLYHSSSMLLPDGSVLTGGGGAPGPVFNLNAEIYYPPYLYMNDGSGQPAPRPTIAGAPTVLGWNQPFNLTMSTTAAVSRVTMLRMGSVTHAFNNEQRFRALTFTQSGATLTLTSPLNKFVAPPGDYMIFAFDANGVPSIAKTVRMM
jgi:hypothetical protein